MPMRFLTADDRFLVILLTMVLWEGERFCDALFCAERATHQSIRLCGCAREQRNHRTQAADVASQRLGSLVVQKDKNVLAATQPLLFVVAFLLHHLSLLLHHSPPLLSLSVTSLSPSPPSRSSIPLAFPFPLLFTLLHKHWRCCCWWDDQLLLSRNVFWNSGG